MDWDQIEGNWKQLTGKVKEQWGKLTDDDLVTIDGKGEQLEGALQERFGIAKDEARQHIDDWLDSLTDCWRQRLVAPVRQRRPTSATLSLYSSLGSAPSKSLMPAIRLDSSSQISACFASKRNSASFGSFLPPSNQAAT